MLQHFHCASSRQLKNITVRCRGKSDSWGRFPEKEIVQNLKFSAEETVSPDYDSERQSTILRNTDNKYEDFYFALH